MLGRLRYRTGQTTDREKEPKQKVFSRGKQRLSWRYFKDLESREILTSFRVEREKENSKTGCEIERLKDSELKKQRERGCRRTSTRYRRKKRMSRKALEQRRSEVDDSSARKIKAIMEAKRGKRREIVGLWRGTFMESEQGSYHLNTTTQTKGKQFAPRGKSDRGTTLKYT